jgi:hypothetical protein
MFDCKQQSTGINICTNRISRTMGMIERTFTCPIVYEVMEELKNSLGFSRG